MHEHGVQSTKYRFVKYGNMRIIVASLRMEDGKDAVRSLLYGVRSLGRLVFGVGCKTASSLMGSHRIEWKTLLLHHTYLHASAPSMTVYRHHPLTHPHYHPGFDRSITVVLASTGEAVPVAERAVKVKLSST